MDISEKINKAIDQLEETAGELTEKAKKKAEEYFTEEKRSEYKKKIDEAAANADDEFTRLGKTIEKEIKDFTKKI